MKKRLFILGTGIAVAAGGLFVLLPVFLKPAAEAVQQKHPAQTAPQPPPKRRFAAMATPALLHVPSLNIEVTIQPVGLTPEGNMDVPPIETVLGWYKHGVYPGNPGAAVLAGHTGHPNKPSLFRQFEKLGKKEQIIVRDAHNAKAVFEIAETATYTPESAPRERIFGSSPNAQLAIITCAGEWKPRENTYSHRYVIYAVRTK